MSSRIPNDRIKKIRALLDQIVAWQDDECLRILEFWDVWEDSLWQAEKVPDERPVLVEYNPCVVFLLGEEPYLHEPPERARIAAGIVEELNDQRLRVPNRSRREPLAAPILAKRVKERLKRYGFSVKGCSKTTVERVLKELMKAPHPLARCIVAVRGALGGYYLDTSRCTASANG